MPFVGFLRVRKDKDKESKKDSKKESKKEPTKETSKESKKKKSKDGRVVSGTPTIPEDSKSLSSLGSASLEGAVPPQPLVDEEGFIIRPNDVVDVKKARSDSYQQYKEPSSDSDSGKNRTKLTKDQQSLQMYRISSTSVVHLMFLIQNEIHRECFSLISSVCFWLSALRNLFFLPIEMTSISHKSTFRTLFNFARNMARCCFTSFSNV